MGWLLCDYGWRTAPATGAPAWGNAVIGAMQRVRAIIHGGQNDNTVEVGRGQILSHNATVST